MDKIKKIHFVGIKGVGMAALAIYAKEKGYQVSGSDVAESFVTDEELKKQAIEVLPFSPQNITKDLDIVVVSAAYSKEHPEVKESRKKHLGIKSYSEVLAEFSAGKQTIVVAGIHGKTTTSAIVSFLLKKANLDPSFVIGAGAIPDLKSSGHYGQGDYFVLEGDEYRKSPEDQSSKFLDLFPKIEIITSIEMDHPDVFNAEEDVYKAFYQFACRIPRDGFIVLCTDYPKAKKLLRSLADRRFETYGFKPEAKWQIINYQEEDNLTIFDLLHNGENYGQFKLKIPGRANVLNVTAAVITLLNLGIKEKLIKKYLFDFSGVKRRFEKIGVRGKVQIFDDYAHHPHAIAMTLEMAQSKFPASEIWCIFQPHTYSRTKKLLKDFSDCFRQADRLIITDIYSSEREKEATISGEDLANAIRKVQKVVKFISPWPKIVQEVIDNVSGNSVIITMGAGDIYKIGEKILENLNEK